MKKMIVRFSAMLLVLWYCFSVIGFNVHTCNASERSFVATFISGQTCADIHTDHEKTCCHHHECDSGMSASLTADCCQDDYHVLSITGCSLEDDHRQHDSCSCCFCVCACETAVVMCPQYSSSHIFCEPVPELLVHGDRRSLLNIWRI